MSSLEKNSDHSPCPHLGTIAKALDQAKRVVVVLGAGISTAAGIPVSHLFAELVALLPESVGTNSKLGLPIQEWPLRERRSFSRDCSPQRRIKSSASNTKLPPTSNGEWLRANRSA